MRRALAPLWTLVLLATAGSLHSQAMPLTLEIRGVAGVPTGDWSELGQPSAGFGYGIAADLQVAPPVSLYLGWDRIRFPGSDATSTDSGLGVGVRLRFLPRTSPLNVHVSGGGYYGSLEVGRDVGQSIFVTRSDSTLGWEGGAGVSFGIASVGLRPSVTFRSHAANVPAIVDFPASELTVSYVVLTLGIAPRD